VGRAASWYVARRLWTSHLDRTEGLRSGSCDDLADNALGEASGRRQSRQNQTPPSPAVPTACSSRPRATLLASACQTLWGCFGKRNPRPLATEARIMPLDQAAKCLQSYTAKLKRHAGTLRLRGLIRQFNLEFVLSCRWAGSAGIGSTYICVCNYLFYSVCVGPCVVVYCCVVVLCVCCVVCCVCVCCLRVRCAFVLFALSRPLKHIGAGATCPPQERRLHVA
jgi:hypothetical protein